MRGSPFAGPRTGGRARTARGWRFAGVAYALAIVLVGANLPTPLYPAYQQVYGFSATLLTVIFVSYAAGVGVALLITGRASDELGRRAVLVPAVVIALASAVSFAAAGGVVWLLAGRALAGLATGAMVGVAPAALADLEPRGDTARASLVASAITVGGLALGPVVAGLVVEYAPMPLRLVYVLEIVVLLPALGAVAALPPPDRPGRVPAALRPRMPSVPAGMRGLFARSTLAFTAGWVGTGVFFGLGPTLAGHVLDASDRLTKVWLVFAVFAVSAVTQLSSGRVRTRTAVIAGLGVFAGGWVLLAVAVAAVLPVLLFVSAVAIGAGQGMSHRAAQAEVTGAAPESARGLLVAAFYMAGYLAVVVLVIAFGAGIDLAGLAEAVAGFGGLVAMLAVLALVLHIPEHADRA